MTGGGRWNRHASDHEPHVLLYVRVIEIQLEQCRCSALASFEIRDLEGLDINQLVLLIDIQRRGVPGRIARGRARIGHADSTAEGGDSSENEGRARDAATLRQATGADCCFNHGDPLGYAPEACCIRLAMLDQYSRAAPRWQLDFGITFCVPYRRLRLQCSVNVGGSSHCVSGYVTLLCRLGARPGHDDRVGTRAQSPRTGVWSGGQRGCCE